LAENREKKPTDYTGLIIAAILLPPFLVFIYFGKESLGITVSLVLGALMVAIRIRWDLRQQLWFWETIGFVLVLHIPFLYFVRIPPAWFHSVAMVPIVFPDCLLTVGIIRLVEKFHERNSGHSAPV
jgi:hypothetical protein